jgi:hypothetical protein
VITAGVAAGLLLVQFGLGFLLGFIAGRQYQAVIVVKEAWADLRAHLLKEGVRR